MKVRTFRDFFGKGNATAEIVCAIKGTVVRRLALKGEIVSVDPTEGPVIEVPADTQITYEPWVMDRGSLLFRCEALPHRAKICTELDVLRYPDGTEDTIGVPDGSWNV